MDMEFEKEAIAMTYTTSKRRRFGYWAATTAVTAALVFSGLSNLARTQHMIEGLAHLGYPVYFTSILGVWKVLGAATLVAPGLPRIKEWAYAGVFFDFTGAVVSHAAMGDGVGQVIPPLGLTVALVVSWTLRPESRRLPAVAAARAG
jgi:hypothetical protein